MNLTKLIGVFCWTVIGLMANPAYALEPFFKLGSDELHCGKQPDINLYEGLIAALREEEQPLKNLGFRRDNFKFKLELVLHFEPGQSDIPTDCKDKLLKISRMAKDRKIGDVLIRSSTRTEGSSEMDIAVASERLEQIKLFMRADRLARRALILELHPLPSSPIIENSIGAGRIVEIYSSPLN